MFTVTNETTCLLMEGYTVSDLGEYLFDRREITLYKNYTDARDAMEKAFRDKLEKQRKKAEKEDTLDDLRTTMGSTIGYAEICRFCRNGQTDITAWHIVTPCCSD